MSPETYEQITVPEHLFGSAAAFLVPYMAVTVNSTVDGQHLSGELNPSCLSAPFSNPASSSIHVCKKRPFVSVVWSGAWLGPWLPDRWGEEARPGYTWKSRVFWDWSGVVLCR